MAPKRVGSASTAGNMLVFDLDGVLVDVTASFRVAIVRTVAALGGGEVAPAEVQALKNAGGFNNDWDLSRELLRQRGRDVEREQVIEVFNRFYLGTPGQKDGLIFEEHWLLPLPLLRELRRRHRLAIFTGRPRADAEFTLRHFGVESAFDPMLALEDVAAQKPDPEGLLRLQREHGPLAAYIGDTVDDARCAAAVPLPFIGIVAPAVDHRAQLERSMSAIGCQFLAPDIANAASHLLGAAATAL
ncbi:MAG TPA: HAD family hydrolase [Terriglobales bacterium]|nr:HAD family hydrolase [Terriglobales bacterium]